MENERIVYNPTAIGAGQGGLGGFGGGGLLEGLLLAGLLGGRRGGLFGGGEGGDGANVLAGDIAAQVVNLQNSGDIKEEVQGTKAAIIADLQAVQGILQSQIAASDKQALAAMYETKIASLQSTNEITNKIGNETQAIAGQMTSFQVSTDKQFCHVDNKIAASTQTILNQLNADKLDSKNDEIAALRAERDRLTTTINFGNQFAAIASQLNNLSQKQDLTNQVVQFGAGNVATPVATNNQVR